MYIIGTLTQAELAALAGWLLKGNGLRIGVEVRLGWRQAAAPVCAADEANR